MITIRIECRMDIENVFQHPTLNENENSKEILCIIIAMALLWHMTLYFMTFLKLSLLFYLIIIKLCLLIYSE